MNKNSRVIVAKAAEILNHHLTGDSAVKKLLTGEKEQAVAFVGAINQILQATAEGGHLVCATMMDGKLLGFVPNFDVNLVEASPPSPVRAPLVPQPPATSVDDVPPPPVD